MNVTSEYARGEWIAVVAGSMMALTSPATPPEVARTLWQAGLARRGYAEYLRVLSWTHFSELPGFALVCADDGKAQLFVRGTGEIVVENDDESMVFSAPDAMTWKERTISLPAAMIIRVAGVTPALSGWPLNGGIADAGSLRVIVSDSGGSGDSAESDARVGELAARVTQAAVRNVTPVAAAPAARPHVPAAPVRQQPARSAESVGQPAAGVESVGRPAAGAPVEPAKPSGQPKPSAQPQPKPSAQPDGNAQPEPKVNAHPESAVQPSASIPPPRVAQPEPAAQPPNPAQPPVPPPPAPIQAAQPVPAPSPQPMMSAHNGARPGHNGQASAGPAVAQVPSGAVQPPANPASQIPDSATPERAPAPPSGVDRTVSVQDFDESRGKAASRYQIRIGSRWTVDLASPVLIGRAPQPLPNHAGPPPRLITVPSPTQDISRTHVEVRQESASAVVTDLHSTNGVLVTAPGGGPHRLYPGEATPVDVGSVVDLGDGIAFTIEWVD